MPQPTKQNISEINISIRDIDALTWYYHLVYTASGLSIQLYIEDATWGTMEEKSYEFECDNYLIREIDDLNIPSWPDCVRDENRWTIDVRYVDGEVVNISGNESSSNWNALLSVLSSYGIKTPDSSVPISTSIIPFPDHEKLKKEVEKLRIGLSMLVLERDHLAYIECKNIEMVYMLSLGGLEYRAFEIECAVRRLKRKIELIQAKKNRQEKVVLSDIEEILDTEFTEFQAKLDAKIGKMNAALDRSKGKELTKSESSELKKLYRGIVKALHPDLHPGNSKEKIQLFLNAVEAYKNCDLTGLRVISEMYVDQKIPEDHKDALALLVKEKERLTELIKKVKASITKMKSSYPYTMKSLIQDPEKMSAKKKKLEGIIEEGKKIIDLFQSKLTDMMR